SIYNKSFRWACKNKDLIKIYSKFLSDIDLYDSYDGSSLVSYNKEEFYNNILPYLKHGKKINLTKLLCKGKGILPSEYCIILNYIKNNPNSNSIDIAKALKKIKLYSELKLLSDFGYISYKDYPYEFKITSKGIKSLGGQNYNTS
ncbi:MAG: hypothetical protein AABY22_04120, partial [Nanoarchaeota archaeon]